jgi:hypothetical protein
VGISTRLGTPADLPEILEVAERAFKNHCGKYNADSRLPPDAAKSVYREWRALRYRMGGLGHRSLKSGGKDGGLRRYEKSISLEAKNALDIFHYDLVALHPHFVRPWRVRCAYL